MKLPICLALTVLSSWACATSGQRGTSAERDTQLLHKLSGAWRAVRSSPGGDLPFRLRIEVESSTTPAVALNGSGEAPFSTVTQRGSRVVLRIDGYDSEIVADISPPGRRLAGHWRKTVPGGYARLPFEATRGDSRRFLPQPSKAGWKVGAEAVPTASGAWGVVFEDDDCREKAEGEFVQDSDHVSGTFLTPTGDYRYLEGEYRQRLLCLSTFDGGHAFLSRARASADGTLKGDFWSRDSYHATWTAPRVELTDGESGLPGAYEIVGLANDEEKLRFTFPDLDDRSVSLSDPRFAGRVVVVNIFGSWCPNCNDEAPQLAGTAATEIADCLWLASPMR